MTITQTPQRFYGRLDAKFPVQLTALHNLITMPAASVTWAGPNTEGFNLGMLGNDSAGDCTFAGFVHLVMAICLLLGVTPPDPTAPEVLQAYFIFTGGQDTGAVEADVLGALYKTGILGIKLAGYANGRLGLPEVLQITEYGGAAYLGIQVPAPMQDQFGAILEGQLEALDLTGTSADSQIEGGHCIDSISFDQNAELIDIITWGARVKCTFRWLNRYLDEHWMAIPVQVKEAGKLDNMNWAQLAADMEALHGVVAP